MLSKKATYSIYALIKLARHHNQGSLLIKDIAESEKIPKKFLETILLELRNAGVLGSKKGKGGGYYLIKDPSEVNLADIIRNFDGAIALLPCATFKYHQSCEHCKNEETCGFRKVIKDVRDETVRILKNTSLADVINIEKELLIKKANT